jgi:signal transduction histidine kinase
LDTKSKKFRSRALIVWLCFFAGLNIVASIMLGSIAVMDGNGYIGTVESIKDAFKNDIKDTRQFKHTITIKFDSLVKALTDTEYLSKKYLPVEGSFTDYYEITEPAEQGATSTDGSYISHYNNYMSKLEILERGLNKEGENLIYYAENLKTGVKLTNSKTDLGISIKGFPSLPQSYNYYFYFDGERFIVENAGKKVDMNNDEIGYSNLWHWGYFDENINNKIPELKDCRIFLVVKKDIVKDIGAMGSLYQLKRDSQIFKLVFIVIVVVFLLGIGLLVFSIIKRETKREFDRKIANFLGKLWFEVKAVVSVVVLIIFPMQANSNWNTMPGLLILIKSLFSLALIFWWFYLMLVDLVINKRKFFSYNSINALIKKYRALESKKPFQKAMLLRIYMLIAAEIVLVLLVGYISLLFFYEGGVLFLLFAIVFAGIGIYLIYRYQRRYSNAINDIGKLIDQIDAIKNGDITTKLALNPGADIYFAAENLNRIQDGIGKAVDEKVMSERTKVELITNVSHDLKTPLTSIISYVDLLSREEGLPEHVNDYIKILIEKSDRLKTLIEDLFDLSKAASGEMEVDYEKLDLGKLIQQTIVDLNEEISQSGFDFKVNVPDEPIFILSDGKKLYRVFLNLISNTLKYSLIGSRIYIDLVTESKKIKATAIIKNTANYEMNFSEDEILERFVRGDKARTGEGSGLGLAIAKNFTQICGGEFDVTVDGDLFKVKLIFDTVE